MSDAAPPGADAWPGSQAAPRPRRWPIWPFLVAGFVVYEISSDAALGVVIACLKFGLEDRRTGFWVRLHDPDPRRGLAVFWTAAACGLFRVGMSAVVGWFVLIGVLFLAFVMGLRGVVLAEQFYALMHLLGALAWPFVAVCLLAVAAILRAGRPIWYGADTRRARRERAWPPSVPRPDRPIGRHESELAVPMLAWPTTALLAAAFQFPGALAAFNRLTDQPAHIRVPSALGTLGLLYAALMFAGPRLSRVVAWSPSDCWPAEAGRPPA